MQRIETFVGYWKIKENDDQEKETDTNEWVDNSVIINKLLEDGWLIKQINQLKTPKSFNEIGDIICEHGAPAMKIGNNVSCKIGTLKCNGGPIIEMGVQNMPFVVLVVLEK